MNFGAAVLAQHILVGEPDRMVCPIWLGIEYSNHREKDASPLILTFHEDVIRVLPIGTCLACMPGIAL